MLFFIKPWKILLWALLTQKLQNKIFISKNLAQSLLKLDGTLMSCKKIENFYEQFWRKIPDKQTNGLFNSNYFTSAKKCWCERCIIVGIHIGNFQKIVFFQIFKRCCKQITSIQKLVWPHKYVLNGVMITGRLSIS